jgi:Fur family transcriptional regulator, iron response regulator
VLFPAAARGHVASGGESGRTVQTSRTYSGVLEQLKAAGLRPTRQRLALAKLLLESGPRHVTAEELFHEARTAGIPVSLATVYNTLHQFTSVGLLREVVVDMGQSYFDTNISHHHHFFDETTRALTDIPDHEIEIGHLPEPPFGSEIDRVEVIVRLRRAAASRTERSD